MRKLPSTNKVKLRLFYNNKNLKNDLLSFRQQLSNISVNTVEVHIKRLRLQNSQSIAIKECIRIAYNVKTNRWYLNDWLLTCLLQYIRGLAIYKYILNNEILPLPCSQTIKRQLCKG